MQGHECFAYLNDGSYAVPNWVELDDIRNLKSPLTKEMQDATTRAHAPYKAVAPGLRSVPVEFEILYDRADPNVVDLEAAFYADTQVELLILDEEHDHAGATGVRASFEVSQFDRQEPEGNLVWVSVKLEVGLSAHPPTQHTVTT